MSLVVANKNNQSTDFSNQIKFNNGAGRSGVNVAIQAQMAQNNTQVLVRCPHGNPGGACPVCMGKTGGGGGANRKRTGMNWDEAYAVWSKLKFLALNRQQDIQNIDANRNKINKEQNTIFSRIMQKMQAFKANIMQYFTKFQNVADQIKTFVVKAFTQGLKTFKQAVVNMIKLPVAKLLGVVNKLTAIFGEKIKNLDERIKETAKQIFEKLLKEGALERLVKVFNEKNLHEFFEKKAEFLKEKFLKVLNLIKFIKKDKENKKRKKRNGQDKQSKKKQGKEQWTAA